MYTAFDRYLRGAQSPCQYCSDRVPACHGTCQKYIEFKTEFERLKEGERPTHKLDALSRRRHIAKAIIARSKGKNATTKDQCRAKKIKERGIQ